MKSKIIALGDSIIKGVVLNIEQSGKMHYALSDHSIADQLASRKGMEAVNLGKMGCTIEAGERILDHHLPSIENAEYAILCYGGNDRYIGHFCCRLADYQCVGNQRQIG